MRPFHRLLPGTACAVSILLPCIARADQAPLAGAAYDKADEAYRRFADRDLAGALAAAEDALRLAPGHRDLQRLKLDILLDQGHLEAADTWLAALLQASPGDPDLRLAKALLRQRQGRAAEAIEEARAVLASGSLPPASQATARLTLADLLLEAGRHGEALEALQTLRGDGSYAVQSRLGFALLGAGNPSAAMGAFRKAQAGAGTPEDRKGVLQGLLDAARSAKDPGTELEALRGLRALDPGSGALAKEEGYALAKAGRNAEALAAFKAALGPASPSADYLDAAYSAKALGRNAEARGLFEGAIAAAPPDKPLPPAELFGIRREVETLSRTWGGSLSTFYHQGALLPGYSSGAHAVQEGAEAYYQPDALSSNGRWIQVYATGFETIHDAPGQATGGPTSQPSVGVRAKPFQSQNLVLSLQRLLKGGRLSQQDWMYQLGYSADTGMDLKAGVPSWTYAYVYTDTAWFQDSRHFVQTCEARLGKSFLLDSLGGGTVLIPHLVAGGDYDNRLASKPSSGAGAGFALRQWFRQTRFQAPASYAELVVQYRFKAGQAERGGGTFATFTLWF